MNWIMVCSVSHVFSNTKWYVKPERGIRHGDHLSSVFFSILCGEALVYIMNKAEREGIYGLEQL